MTKVTGTISQLNITGTITQKNVTGTITQKSETGTITEGGYVPDPPVFVSAVVENAAPDDVVITLSESLDESSVPATTAFTVSGVTDDPSVDNVAVSGTDVTLTLSGNVVYGDTVTVSYTKPGSNPLQDLVGDDVASFTDESVTNNVEQAYCDEYQAVLDYWTGEGWDLPSEATSTIFNTMVETIVDLGVWAKGEFFDFFSTHNQNCAVTNWFNPGTFIPSEVNAPVWTQYQGYTGDSAGVKYLRSNFIPSVDGTLIGQDNICAMIGVGNNIKYSAYDFGLRSTAGTNVAFYIMARSGVGDLARWTCNDFSLQSYANNNSKKHFTVSRGNAANYDTYLNFDKTNLVNASTVQGDIEIFICARNNNGSAEASNRQLRYALLTSYLTEEEVTGTIGSENTYLTNYGTNLY